LIRVKGPFQLTRAKDTDPEGLAGLPNFQLMPARTKNADFFAV
jgi:hypothetical protein